MPITPLDAGNLAVVVGSLSSDPRRRQLASGSELVEFDVTTRGPAGTSSVPISWFEPGPLADRLGAGSGVAVVGTVRRRFFRSGGATLSRTEVIAAKVVDAARGAPVRRLLADAAAALDPASFDPAALDASAAPGQRTRKATSSSPSGAGSSATSMPVTSARGGP